MLSIGIFGSGKGSNAQSLIDAIKADKLNARIVCILSDVQDAFILDRARQNGIPAYGIGATGNIFQSPKANSRAANCHTTTRFPSSRCPPAVVSRNSVSRVAKAPLSF